MMLSKPLREPTAPLARKRKVVILCDEASVMCEFIFLLLLLKTYPVSLTICR